MFERAVFQEPVAKRQRAAVVEAVNKAIRNGTCTYTDILMADEPVRTYALEHLDGCTSESGSSSQVSNALLGEPIRLVCLNAKHTIKVSRWGTRRIWGTNEQGPAEKIPMDLGNDALVDDRHPERIARGVLRRNGWPIRNKLSRTANDGSVVEWRWLEREAKEKDAPPEVVEHYRAILERTAPEAPAKQQTKSAGASASAHP